ncbi:hypothetical protein JZ751_008042, partial [Albula glossodonta]
MKLKEDELKQFQSHLNQNYPECTERQQAPDALHIIEKMLETCGSDTSLKITLHILRNMEQKDLADSLERNELKEARSAHGQYQGYHLSRRRLTHRTPYG